MKKLAKNISDGFKNIMKGLGTNKDPQVHTDFVSGIRISQALADSLYTYWWLASKVVNIPVDDATKKWRKLIIDDPEKKKELEQSFKTFQVQNKVNLAKKWARVFGGAAIVVVIEGQDLSTPLETEKIAKDSLKDLIVLDRYNIHPEGIDRDILSGRFGQPEFYRVSRSGQDIHHTRVIRFDGETSTLRQVEENDYWGVSIYTRLWDVMKESGTITSNIANLIWDAVVDVYRIDGLHEMVAEGDDETVVKRLEIVHQMKSLLNAVVLDKDDEYDKKTNSFASLAEIDDRGMQKVAGAADISLTRLLGTSPSGMNATGESDKLNYWDNIESIQRNEIDPIMHQIDPIIVATTFGKVEDLEYEWNPLQQLTEVEKATVENQRADRDDKYETLGVVNKVDIITQLAEDGTYVTIDANRVEEEIKEQELLELEFGEEEESTSEESTSEEEETEEENIEEDIEEEETPEDIDAKEED